MDDLLNKTTNLKFVPFVIVPFSVCSFAGLVNTTQSRLTIQNASNIRSQGVFVCQASQASKQQHGFVIGNEQYLRRCLSHRNNEHEERESKYMSSYDQYTTRNKQWYYNHRENNDYSSYQYYQHSFPKNTFSYYSVSPNNAVHFQDSSANFKESPVDPYVLNSYFPNRDTSSGSDTYPITYFKPSVDFPYKESIKPIREVINITEEHSNHTNNMNVEASISGIENNTTNTLDKVLNNSTLLLNINDKAEDNITEIIKTFQESIPT